MPITWNDDLKTGIADIDYQHQLFFETINKLGEVDKVKDRFYEILIELQTYVSVHFRTEEEYMRFTHYPGYQVHEECHAKFVAQYKIILKKISQAADIMDLGPELVVFLGDWINAHYQNEDVKLASHINKYRLKGC